MGKTKYRSDYPCCGQSRFKPAKRTAIDGRVWWCVWDNKEGMYLHGRHNTRRDCVLTIYMNLRHGRFEFEPDEEGKDLQWLRCEARGGVIRHEQKKVNCQEPLRASCTKA